MKLNLCSRLFLIVLVCLFSNSCSLRSDQGNGRQPTLTSLFLPSSTPTGFTKPTPTSLRQVQIHFWEAPISLDELDDKEREFAIRISKDLYMQLEGVYSINPKNVFLFGCFNSMLTDLPAHYCIRSILLQSTDQGETWQEVWKPQGLTNITHVLFIKGGEGWLVTETNIKNGVAVAPIFASGKTSLWHTLNGGQSWELINDLPMGYTVGAVQFFDSNNGRIVSLIPSMRAESQPVGLVIHLTSDGGRSWRESERVSLQDLNPYIMVNVMNTYYGVLGGKYGSFSHAGISIGWDGSEWFVSKEQDSGNERFILSRQLPGELKPTYFDFSFYYRYSENGQIDPLSSSPLKP